MKTFSTENLNRVFNDIDYIGFKNLMFDLANNKEIYDESGERVIRTEEANEKIRKVCYAILNLDEHSTKRDINRALKKHGQELFEVIEEVIDRKVSTGFRENEFFNDFVESRNIAEGDSVEFWVDDDIILNVAKVAGDHHDLIIQTLSAGQAVTIPMSKYAVKVGKDITLFLTNRLDWTKFTDAVAKAFISKIQNTLYSEIMNASTSLPNSSQFNKSGALNTAQKETFDQLIEDVQTANDGAPVVIMGTKTALKKITGLADVDWASNTQKEDIAATGILGSYEGTALVEIPQRFKENDVTKKLVDANALLIMPMIDGNKIGKFVDGGETEIELTDRGATIDDQQTYEVQRSMGVGVVTSIYFGKWTITA